MSADIRQTRIPLGSTAYAIESSTTTCLSVLPAFQDSFHVRVGGLAIGLIISAIALGNVIASLS